MPMTVGTKRIKHSFIIFRERWNSGQRGNKKSKFLTGGLVISNSSLLNEYGQLCCLGFFAHSQGISLDELLNVSSPFGNISIRLEETFFGNISRATLLKLIGVNDDTTMDEISREAEISHLFYDNDISVTFK